jgi:hypothetical protein
LGRCEDGGNVRGPTTIHGVLNRSTHTPIACEKKAGRSAWVMLPSSASASERRFESATSASSKLRAIRHRSVAGERREVELVVVETVDSLDQALTVPSSSK